MFFRKNYGIPFLNNLGRDKTLSFYCHNNNHKKTQMRIKAVVPNTKSEHFNNTHIYFLDCPVCNNTMIIEIGKTCYLIDAFDDMNGAYYNNYPRGHTPKLKFNN